jgi:hypothetical protein
MNVGGLESDPFDAPNFNPVEYINGLFPDETALSNLNAYKAELGVLIDSMETAVQGSVRTQALAGGRVADSLGGVKTAMHTVARHVTEVREGAQRTEATVDEICRDIRALDNAKRNITQSIKCVRRMQMLESAIAKLQHLSRDDDFKEAAPLVHAAQQLLAQFADRPGVPSLQQMGAQFAAIRTELASKVMLRFPTYDPTTDGPPPPGLAAACALIDAIGGEAPKQFMKAFIQSQLEKYSRKFHRGEANALLANADKRYQWFRKYLEILAERCPDVFPAGWCLPQEMAVEFCLLTHQHLSQQLQDEAANMDVPALVKALQRSQQFERELSLRWQPHWENGGGDEGHATSSETERIRQKYAKARQGADKPQRRASQPDAAAEAAAQYRFHGFITSCFDQAMHLYVDFEDQQMRETVDRLIAEESWGSADGEGTMGESEILTSASDLFILIEEGLKRAAALLRGGTLLKMHRVWSKNLVHYADRLGGVVAPAKGPDKGDRVTCLVINTADYWAGIIPQLTAEIRGKVDEISRPEVNLDAAHDAFSVLINKGIRALTRSIEAKMEPHLTELTKANWANLATVEDQSPYVAGLCSVLSDRMAVIVRHLNGSYVKLFCTKFVVYFLRRFVQQFYRCRRISETGCQQLLIDLQHLRKKLHDLPNEGCADRFPGAALVGYVKLLNGELKKAENVLKVVMAPNADKNLVTDYADLAPYPSVPDFIKLMELKGLKKGDLGPLLEQVQQNRKIAKTEHTFADEEFDVQPQEVGTGSVLGEWKRRLGGSIKAPVLPEYMKLGDLPRPGSLRDTFLLRGHHNPSHSM